MQAGKLDDTYQQLKHMLQKQGTRDWDVDYHLMIDGLVRFRDRIYVPDESELNKLILRGQVVFRSLGISKYILRSE